MGHAGLGVRRTKLICTLGPASARFVPELVEAGMDVARVNFSHGTEAERRGAFASIRAAAWRAGRPVGIMADLPGPKARLGEMGGGRAELVSGNPFVLRCDARAGDTRSAPMDPWVAGQLRPGDQVLLADGAVELRVLECGGEVVTEVVRGGWVRSRAGVNLPRELDLPALPDLTSRHLEAAMEMGADFVAQSFVRRAEDVGELRDRLGGRPVRVIAKVETRGAVHDAGRILESADGIMVARGDLGAEVPYDEVPLIQKELIRRAQAAGKPAIVATQMLESMIHSPRPTRAEVSDVANAVLDGAEGVLLSAETALGAYPVEAGRAASRIIETVERYQSGSSTGLLAAG